MNSRTNIFDEKLELLFHDMYPKQKRSKRKLQKPRENTVFKKNKTKKKQTKQKQEAKNRAKSKKKDESKPVFIIGKESPDSITHTNDIGAIQLALYLRGFEKGFQGFFDTTNPKRMYIEQRKKLFMPFESKGFCDGYRCAKKLPSYTCSKAYLEFFKDGFKSVYDKTQANTDETLPFEKWGFEHGLNCSARLSTIACASENVRYFTKEEYTKKFASENNCANNKEKEKGNINLENVHYLTNCNSAFFNCQDIEWIAHEQLRPPEPVEQEVFVFCFGKLK